MKKTKHVWIILLMCTLFLQGCVEIKLDIGESIAAPKNKLIPIKGTWKIEKYHTKNYALKKEKINDLIGKTARFNEECVNFGEEICRNPEYKMKNIHVEDYFLYTYKKNYKDLGITNKSIEVISITSKEKHFYDFMKVKENQLIIYIDDVFYYLSKISDTTDGVIVQKNNESKAFANTENQEEPNLLRSGVLVGMRSSGNNTNQESETYRTLWIATKNRILYPVLEKRNLFVPRKSGFWIVGKDRFIEEGEIKDRLFAYPYKQNTIEKGSIEQEYMYEKSQDEKITYDTNKNTLRKILFVGNDYIATAYGQLENSQIDELVGLQVRPIDNIRKNVGIKISDISGELGKDALLNSAKGYLTTRSKSEANSLNKLGEEHFTLSRRNGHWIIKGRLYYKEADRENEFLEFNISMLPPKKIVQYDKLYVSWNEVKAKVPKALDVYTSPNKDFAIIVTKEEVYIYGLRSNQLSHKYMKKIKLKEGETVVMAEWATGSYVERWNNTITNIGLMIK
ncbi:hypothetical protein [Marinisporobacter balticus]|uniref:Lipoprotein n=1 Tax=Marinisporobacter balticus TaxID=2018667 RepID=A0A4R2KZ70_9FIRM|nr:hypothetical protein [Marinisporobacter balticus]TCO79404.1 hypothetical protein EV214_102122 [Marinisporobacter balticus]